MYNFNTMKKVEVPSGQVPYDVQVILDEIAKPTHGKAKRVTIHVLLKRANESEESTLVQRILLATLITNFIKSSTTNAEVVNARKTFDLLGDYLNDIEQRLDRYEEILAAGLYLPPTDEPIPTSKVTFIIQRGGG